MTISDDKTSINSSIDNIKNKSHTVTGKIPGISREILNKNDWFKAAYVLTPFYFTRYKGTIIRKINELKEELMMLSFI